VRLSGPVLARLREGTNGGSDVRLRLARDADAPILAELRVFAAVPFVLGLDGGAGNASDARRRRL